MLQMVVAATAGRKQVPGLVESIAIERLLELG